MSDELKPLPCPFCGGAINTPPTLEQIEYNSWVASINCNNCDISMTTQYTGSTPDAAIKSACKAWNRRPTPEQSREARAIPTTPQEMIEFIGSNFDSMQADQWTDEVIPKPAGDLSNVRYSLTVHDLLSAFDWAGLHDAAMDRSALGREG